MNLMKRLLPLLLLVTFSPLFASCRSESKPDATAGATPSAPSNAATPPPGMVEVSTDTFRKDVEQNPEDPVAHYNLGTAYLAEGKFSEAAEEFKFVVSKNSKDSDALAKLGISYASAGRPVEAADAFKRALALTPNSAELHQRLAEVYEKSGKTSDAAKERAQVRKLRPNDHATELYKQGRYEEAVGELQKSADKNAESYALLGFALLKLIRRRRPSRLSVRPSS
jgi:tetratricopeptide (TPR) repeat protein